MRPSAKKCQDGMIAVDTNVLVRLLTGDHPRQEMAARSILARDSVWVAKTVIFETAWVLSRLYAFDDAAIVDGLTRFLGLDNVQAEDEPAVAAALALTAHGIQFADALHLASRPPGASFVTFDKTFVRRAKRAAVSDISGI
jgi:predicted nucleic acid-binding protein